MACADKHSVYYRIPERFEKHSAWGGAPVDRMYEKARFRFMSDNVSYSGASLLDIGCNTGYFLFSALDSGAVEVDCYEGSISAFGILKGFVDASREQVSAYSRYFDFSSDVGSKKYNVVHLLNVVHHVGDDYLDGLDFAGAKEKMLEDINRLAAISKIMVFQMGFNWQGDARKPLFLNGTKREMIEFLEEGVLNSWEIQRVGVAVGSKEHVVYLNVDDKNVERDDSLGEFLNRPIFIMKSKFFK